MLMTFTVLNHSYKASFNRGLTSKSTKTKVALHLLLEMASIYGMGTADAEEKMHLALF